MIVSLDRVQIDICNEGDETFGDGEPIRSPCTTLSPRGFLRISIDSPANSSHTGWEVFRELNTVRNVHHEQNTTVDDSCILGRTHDYSSQNLQPGRMLVFVR